MKLTARTMPETSREALLFNLGERDESTRTNRRQRRRLPDSVNNRNDQKKTQNFGQGQPDSARTTASVLDPSNHSVNESGAGEERTIEKGQKDSNSLNLSLVSERHGPNSIVLRTRSEANEIKILKNEKRISLGRRFPLLCVLQKKYFPCNPIILSMRTVLGIGRRRRRSAVSGGNAIESWTLPA